MNFSLSLEESCTILMRFEETAFSYDEPDDLSIKYVAL